MDFFVIFSANSNTDIENMSKAKLYKGQLTNTNKFPNDQSITILFNLGK